MATAAAEAMTLCHAIATSRKLFVANNCHPQTIEVVQTRAKPLGIEVVGIFAIQIRREGIRGLVQYPATDGRFSITNLSQSGARSRRSPSHRGRYSCSLPKATGEMGADVAVGSTQRFGVPLGGGPTPPISRRGMLQTAHAGTARWRFTRYHRPARLSAGASDPRTTHSA